MTLVSCRALARAFAIAFAIAAATPALAQGTKIDGADTAWMIVATAIVLMMTIPGLALFYSGPGSQLQVSLLLLFAFSAGLSNWGQGLTICSVPVVRSSCR
jgi:hypothetical protein